MSTQEHERYVGGAIRWARSKIGSTDYPLRCLAFVEDCYEEGNGIEVFGGLSATESARMYGVTSDPMPPPVGAFVFYQCEGMVHGVKQDWGHVGISVGNGRLIHAWEKVREDDYLEVQGLEPASGWTQPRYMGWASPSTILKGHVARKRIP